jgi:hypothetical protein
MEISPITGIRNQPTVSRKETVLELPGVFEIEHSSRTGDETYSPSGGKPSGGYEDDEDEGEEDVYEHLEEDPKLAPSGQAALSGQARPVSYFA